MGDTPTPFKQLTEQEQVAYYHARDRRSHAQDHGSFDDDIASNFDMGTVAALADVSSPYQMPKDAQIGVSFSTSVTAGQLTVDTNGGRTLGTPALAANQVHRLGKFNQALLLTPSCAIAGTVTLHVFDEWFRPSAIATGVFT